MKEIPWEHLNGPKRIGRRRYIRFGQGKFQQLTGNSDTSMTPLFAFHLSHDKQVTNRMLAELRLPVPRQKKPANVEEALIAAEKIGYPVVVKPLNGGHGLGLVNVEEAQRWNSRGHFFSAAAEAMRRILVEQARRKGSWKAGGRMARMDLADVEPEVLGSQLDLIALDEALSRLEAEDPRSAQVVKLWYFAGLTVRQAAES